MRRPAAWAGLALGLALLAAVAGFVVVVVRDGDGDGAERAAPPDGLAARLDLDGAPPADAPFAGMTELDVAVGGDCARVVVADDETERVAGLRGRRDPGDYRGMLFVYGSPTEVAFTMSGVPVALDIGFYDASGRPVSRQRMRPCPRAEGDCPLYRAAGPFVFALETLAGDLPDGPLAPCEP